MTVIYMNIKTDTFYMKTLSAIHKILGIYDDCLDTKNLDLDRLNAKTLKLTENRFSRIIEMLYDSGYISGVNINEFLDGTINIDYSESQITLEGLKYYAENSLFLKAAGFLPEIISTGVSIIK